MEDDCQCKFSDAWKCGKERRLHVFGEMACKCKCHKMIYCHACSKAGGAGMPIRHLPPACKEKKSETGAGAEAGN